MSERNDDARPGQVDTPGTHPLWGDAKRVPCPSWCVRHEDDIDGPPADRCRVHYGDEGEVAGYSAHLIRYDWLKSGRPGSVSLVFQGEFLTVSTATALAGLLASTAAKHEPDDETVVTTIDLPEGKDYVTFDDLNIVGLSSRLDEDGRREVLRDLGLT